MLSRSFDCTRGFGCGLSASLALGLTPASSSTHGAPHLRDPAAALFSRTPRDFQIVEVLQIEQNAALVWIAPPSPVVVGNFHGVTTAIAPT